MYVSPVMLGGTFGFAEVQTVMTHCFSHQCTQYKKILPAVLKEAVNLIRARALSHLPFLSMELSSIQKCADFPEKKSYSSQFRQKVSQERRKAYLEKFDEEDWYCFADILIHMTTIKFSVRTLQSPSWILVKTWVLFCPCCHYEKRILEEAAFLIIREM